MSREWTEEEDEIILKHYPTRGAKNTVRILGGKGFQRTYGAVRMRAKFLGVRAEHRSTCNNAWSKAELDVLREHFGSEGAKGVMLRLRKIGSVRSAGAIAMRASMLGLRRSNTKRRPAKGDTVIRNFCLDTVLDADLIRRLDSVPNRSRYVRELIMRDIESSK